MNSITSVASRSIDLAGADRLISKLSVQNSPKAHYVVEKQKGTSFVVHQCLQENMLLSGV